MSEIEKMYENATMNFENTLAKLINNLWQSLSEEEKASIKNILEM